MWVVRGWAVGGRWQHFHWEQPAGNQAQARPPSQASAAATASPTDASVAAPPALQALALIGEFNAWEPQPEHWAIKNDYGVWNLFLPDKPDGTPAIQHRCGGFPRLPGFQGLDLLSLQAWDPDVTCSCRTSHAGQPHSTQPGLPRTLCAPRRTKVKVRLETAYGEWVERIPAWIKWATQVGSGTAVLYRPAVLLS